MGVRKETYLIYGCKFGEEFTREFWESDFREEMEYFGGKDNGKIKFISDGMNGLYTFFGQVIELSRGGDWYEDQIREIDLSQGISSEEIVRIFNDLHTDQKIKKEDIKLYYVPHYT